MKIRTDIIGTVALCTFLGACHWQFWKHEIAVPTGQVVARVGQHEITTRQLAFELQGTTIPDARLQKIARDRALQSIIVRTILADAAVAQGLDNDPDYAIRKERADQLALVEALQLKIAHGVP